MRTAPRRYIMSIAIGNQIKALRRSSGMTQADFAKLLCVTPQAVSKWERNVSYPDITMLPTIARYFGISIDRLFGYDDVI